MIEKLKEILEKNQLRFIDYEIKQKQREHKISFFAEHRFENELDMLLKIDQNITNIYFDYQRIIEDIKKLVDSLEK